MKLADGKWWCSATLEAQPLSTIVTKAGGYANGRITHWLGDGEVELDTGKRGVLLETWQRRNGKRHA